MDIFPEFRIQVLNGWLLLVGYFLGLSVVAGTFPAEKRRKLFLEPRHHKGDPRRVPLLLGRAAVISFVGLMIFSPLRLATPLLYTGLVVYFVGYVAVMASLLHFRRTPAGETVKVGLYRYTRNPQWLGLVLVYLGASVAVGSWLHLGLLLVLVYGYHFQILLEEEACLDLYGERYKAYMEQVPRYILLR
jgi:protein-S-isoprenylcysteine O-methyltransferase Ste14